MCEEPLEADRKRCAREEDEASAERKIVRNGRTDGERGKPKD